MAVRSYSLIPKGFPNGGAFSWHYVCDTEAELPTVGEGCTAYTKDSQKQWKRTSNAWADAATSGVPASDSFAAKCVSLQSVATAADTNPVSVPNCSFTFVANGVYLLWICGTTSAALATTGSGFQIDTSVAVSVVNLSFVHPLANTGTVTGGSSIADDASVGVSSGRPSANVATPVMGMGTLVAGANGGTATLRYRSEVAAVSTVLAGFVFTAVRIA